MSTLTERLGMDDADWMSHPDRNCRPPAGATNDQIAFTADLYFPAEGSEGEAMKLCRGCPVRALCADYGIANPELVGVWGGTTTAMRVKIRVKARKAA